MTEGINIITVTPQLLLPALPSDVTKHVDVILAAGTSLSSEVIEYIGVIVLGTFEVKQDNRTY